MNDDLHGVFRPRAARVVSLVLAGAVLVLMVAIAVLLPWGSIGGGSVLDRLGIVGFGVLVAWFLSRQASVRAVPDERGLVVRNLLLTRRVEWTEIVSVRFGQGRPWVQLDLADGDTIAVMGIQRADGDRATAESRRLATLVALHSATPRDD
ncbi:PH domain-containing protein [Actinotalea sp.]|uniref:PH domain-containing protein n=1 Tax=Actinotalea sp. TaxID=1872145 RepID=UPI002C7E0EE3|nr:PH domain-containing protein [Actinotalea sp.]HQY32660.1 PH domain-containing protein [Actinotalea sp.]HRA50438.1 PH domain-containing protein [Actinotalea sp.]